MKKHAITFLSLVALFSCTFSCTALDPIVTDKVTSISATDSKADTYMVGDVYFETNDLIVIAHYNNGEDKTLQRGEYVYEMKDNLGNYFDASTPFIVGGVYVLDITYKNEFKKITIYIKYVNLYKKS